MKEQIIEGEFIQVDEIQTADQVVFNKENLPLDYSKMAVSGIRLPSGAGFGRAAAELLNPLGYGVFPCNAKGDPKVGYKDKYLQDDLCPLSHEKFNNSPIAYVVIDDNQQALLWIDCDCYGEQPGYVRQLMMEAFGIDEQTFNQSLFQHNDDETSVHLVFRVSRGIRKEIIKDRDRGNDFFVTNMKTKDDARIPPRIEIKVARRYNQCRLKPHKTLYPKSRDAFPSMPDMVTDILMSVKINNARAARARKTSRPTEYKRRTGHSSDVDQQRREQRGVKIFNGILDDINFAAPGTRYETVRDKSSQAGYYCHSWNIPESEMLTKLLDAAEAVADAKDKKNFRTTVKQCFEYGLAHPEIQPLDD